MEKIPGFRIVGGASEEEKQKTRTEIESHLVDHIATLPEHGRKELEKLEYPKTETEVKLIEFANDETSRLREACGLEVYDIPLDNYHIVPPEVYKKISEEGQGIAFTNFGKQIIAINAFNLRSNPVHFGSSILHETLHLKGHLTFEVEKLGEKIKQTPFREGVTVFPAQKKGLNREYHEHFSGLHEAIVSEQEKKSFSHMMDLPILKEEKDRLNSAEAKELKEKISKERKVPIDDIVWVNQKGDDYEAVVYRMQRKVLSFICEEIQKEFPEEYENAEQVFKEFLKAHFTGRLLPIARLVEKTFGEGGFRMLGNMGTDRASGVLCYESMRKARLRAIK
ncbi:MAG: hypothetical protein PHF79_02255 [Candidatus Pacebacteria bacterium]|nr:hypothetical protein [Candidatus Paceibacterota bacterium]